MKTLKIYFFLLIAVASLFASSCEKDDDVIKEPEEKLKSNFTLMINGNDPLIATANEDDGSEIDFFGTRYSNGVPLLINLITVKHANDTMQYFLDEQGRPIKMIAANKTEFYLEWTGFSKAILTVVTKDGETQINTEVDFNTSNGRIYSERKKMSESARLNESLKLEFLPGSNSTSSYGAKILNDANCLISVTKCDLPNDALSNISVIAKSTAGEHLGYFPAKRLESGKYGVSIPNNTAPRLNLSEVCESVAGTLEHACIITEVPNLPLQLCSALTAAVASSGIGAAVAPLVAEACASAMVD